VLWVHGDRALGSTCCAIDPRQDGGSVVSAPQRLNLALRVLMEAGVVAALAYWGVQTGTSTATRVLLGLGAPAAGFAFWGAVDFHRAGRVAEPLRLIQELVVSFLAALTLYAVGPHVLGVALAVLSVVYHALVYLSGERLLKPRRGERVGDNRSQA
jgi:Protein of unknown function (DUF2568)